MEFPLTVISHKCILKKSLQNCISAHLYFPQSFAGCGRSGRGPGGEAEKHHLREKKKDNFKFGALFSIYSESISSGKSGHVSLTCFFLYSSIVRNFSCSAWNSLESGGKIAFKNLHFPQILLNGKITKSNNYGIPDHVPSLEYVLLVLLVLQEE